MSGDNISLVNGYISFLTRYHDFFFINCQSLREKNRHAIDRLKKEIVGAVRPGGYVYELF